jgi:hypothetical protein
LDWIASLVPAFGIERHFLSTATGASAAGVPFTADEYGSTWLGSDGMLVRRLGAPSRLDILVRPGRGMAPLAARVTSRRNRLTQTVLHALSGRLSRLGKSTMGEPKRAVLRGNSEPYREVASKLQLIARQSRLPGTRQKILDLALRFETAPSTSTGEAQRRISPRTPAK